MRIDEVLHLTEERVYSSWIYDITPLTRQGLSGRLRTLIGGVSDVVMTLGNGNRYLIKDVPNSLIKRWLSSTSKGRFWHWQIKDRYPTQKLAPVKK